MITLENVTVSLEQKTILKGLSLTTSRLGFTVIIGRNGSGKSTLLKTIAGLLEYQGSIKIDNKEIKKLPRKERAQQLALLPQQRPLPDIDVETLVSHGRFPYLGFGKQMSAGDRQIVEEALIRADVSDLRYRRMRSLSGGERQRVYIAMMIAQDTKYLLLDEPTTFLDVEYQLEVMNLLKSLQEEGKHIIMVAHDLPQAFTFAEEVIVLADGELICQGRPEEIYNNSALKEVFSVRLCPQVGEKGLYKYQLEK